MDGVTAQVSRDGWVRCRGGSGSGKDRVVHGGDGPGVGGVQVSQHLSGWQLWTMCWGGSGTRTAQLTDLEEFFLGMLVDKTIESVEPLFRCWRRARRRERERERERARETRRGWPFPWIVAQLTAAAWRRRLHGVRRGGSRPSRRGASMRRRSASIMMAPRPLRERERHGVH